MAGRNADLLLRFSRCCCQAPLPPFTPPPCSEHLRRVPPSHRLCPTNSPLPVSWFGTIPDIIITRLVTAVKRRGWGEGRETTNQPSEAQACTSDPVTPTLPLGSRVPRRLPRTRIGGCEKNGPASMPARHICKQPRQGWEGGAKVSRQVKAGRVCEKEADTATGAVRCAAGSVLEGRGTGGRRCARHTGCWALGRLLRGSRVLGMSCAHAPPLSPR